MFCWGLTGISSKCQTVWIQIRPGVLLGPALGRIHLQRSLLRQNQSSEKEKHYFSEIITCDPLRYTMNHSDFLLCIFMENPIGPKRVMRTYSFVNLVRWWSPSTRLILLFCRYSMVKHWFCIKFGIMFSWLSYKYNTDKFLHSDISSPWNIYILVLDTCSDPISRYIGSVIHVTSPLYHFRAKFLLKWNIPETIYPSLIPINNFLKNAIK